MTEPLRPAHLPGDVTGSPDAGAPAAGAAVGVAPVVAVRDLVRGAGIASP